MEWLSLNEVAELEGVEYNTIVYRRLRGYYNTTKTEPSADGGKDMVFISLDSLSDKAQELYARRKKAEADKVRVKMLSDETLPPWYYGIDTAWYIKNYKKEYLQKVSMAQAIDKYLAQKNEHHLNTTEFTDSFALEHLNMSGKQFRRYIKRYDEGAKWAFIANDKSGDNYDMYKIFALCTPPKVGKNTKLTDEMKAEIENLWASELYHQNLQTVQMLYDDFANIFSRKQAEYIPSYNTVKRYIEVIKTKNSNVKTLLQYGVYGFRHDVMMKRKRDLASLEVMELVQGDAHTFDCWVKHTLPNGKITAIRPYLVGFIDTRSRVLVGWGICVQPNAEVIKQVIIHMIYPKKDSIISGVPRVLYIDNGKDFTAQTLTGRTRKERFDIDGEIKGFYKSIGIEYDMRALPYTPWSKSQIERFFETLIQNFTKRFESYTGTLTGSKTCGKVKKDIRGMLERDELYSMDEFASMFEVYLNDTYHQKVHSGLKEQGEKQPIPIKVFENAERYFKACPPLEYSLSLLGKTAERNVYNVGIEIKGNTYMHEELAGFIGEKVLCRYHDSDMSFITVYNMEGRQICRAYTYERLNPIASNDDEALKEHVMAQRRQLRRAREDIKSLQTPYEERGLQLPELSDVPAKVVSLPQDRQYKQAEIEKQIKSKQNEKKERITNEFITKQAMKAFERIG